MAYDVTIARLPLMALFELQGEEDSVKAWCGAMLPPFPTRPNSLTKQAGRSLCWIGPDRWMLRAALEEEAALLAALKPADAPSEASVVLISDALAFFAIAGLDADRVMAVATPLDIARLAEDDVTMTEAFSTKAMVRRIASGYELAVDQSYAHMVGEYFNRIKG